MMIIAKISSLVKTKDMTKERKIPTMKIDIHGDIKEHFKQRLIVRMSFSLLWLLGCQFWNNFHFSSWVRSEIFSKMQSCVAGPNHNGPGARKTLWICFLSKKYEKTKNYISTSSFIFELFALFQFWAFFGTVWPFWCFRENLPVFDQLLPDYFPHDLRADAEQLGDSGVGVVEAVQQNLQRMSLLLSFQPERVNRFTIQCLV